MPVPFFGMSPNGERIKSALAVSASPDIKAAMSVMYFSAFIFGSQLILLRFSSKTKFELSTSPAIAFRGPTLSGYDTVQQIENQQVAVA